MSNALQSEIQNRILRIEQFFHCISGLMPDPTTASVEIASAVVVAKGLAFVELYGVYEYTIVHTVRHCIADIKSHKLPINALRTELLALALEPEITSVRTCGRERIWNARMQLFQRANSTDPIDIADGVFPIDGSHFRVTQLETISQLFGTGVPLIPAGRMIGLISELVENRNAIAHGRITASDVGRNYTVEEIRSRIKLTQELCLHICSTLVSHCANVSSISK